MKLPISLLVLALCAVVVALAQPVPVPAPVPLPPPPEPSTVSDTPALRFALDFSVSLDPHASRGAQSFKLAAALYDTLYTYAPGPTPVIVPSLAESLPKVSEDGLTWTITLRKGVKFHNSSAFENKTRELVASDVIHSLKRFSTPSEDEGMYWLISGIIKGLDEYSIKRRDMYIPGTDARRVDGLTAVDDHTIQLKLTRPFGGLLTVLAHPSTAIMPREAIDTWDWGLSGRAVGTGPYRLHAVSEGSLIILKRFDGYWGEKPAFERIVLLRESSLEAYHEMLGDGRLSMLELGEDSLAELAPGQKPGPLLTKLKASPVFTDEAGMFFLSFNMEDKLWGALDADGRALRKAVSLALNREQAALDGGMVLPWIRGATECMPPGYEFAEVAARHQLGGHDPKAAKAVLDASKYKGGIDPATGEPLYFELAFRGFDYDVKVAEHTRSALKDLGIECTMRALRGDYRESMRTDSGHLFSSGWFLDSPDAQNWLQLFYGPNSGTSAEFMNTSRYQSADYDKLYLEFEALLPTPANEAKRKELAGKMFALLELDRPMIPAIVRRQCTVRNPGIEWPAAPAATYNEWRQAKPARTE